MRVNTGSHPRPDLEGSEEFQSPTMSIASDKAEVSILEHGGWWLAHTMGTCQVAGVKSDFCYRNWQRFHSSNDSGHIRSTMLLLNFSEIASNYGKSFPCGHSDEESSTQVSLPHKGSLPLWLYKARKDHLLCYFKAFLQCDPWGWNEDRSLTKGTVLDLTHEALLQSEFGLWNCIFGQKITHILPTRLSSGCSNKMSQGRGLVNTRNFAISEAVYLT